MNVLLVFASDQGQTARIMRYIGETLEEEASAHVQILDVRDSPPSLALEAHDAVIIGASLHNWRFQDAIADFVSYHLDALGRLPTAFVSVSLAQADPDPARQRQLDESLEHFFQETRWRPDRIASFAGAFPETRSPWLSRLFWRRLDRERDDFTDWDAVARFALSFAQAMRASNAHPPPLEFRRG